MGTVWGVTACVLIIVSVLLVRKDKERFEQCHKWVMYTMVVGGWLFVLLYFAGYFLRSAPVDMPRSLIPWFAVHGTLALVALLGATLLLTTRDTVDRDSPTGTGLVARLNNRHRLYGSVIALLWLFTHIGGIVNLYLLR